MSPNAGSCGCRNDRHKLKTSTAEIHFREAESMQKVLAWHNVEACRGIISFLKVAKGASHHNHHRAASLFALNSASQMCCKQSGTRPYEYSITNDHSMRKDHSVPGFPVSTSRLAELSVARLLTCWFARRAALRCFHCQLDSRIIIGSSLEMEPLQPPPKPMEAPFVSRPNFLLGQGLSQKVRHQVSERLWLLLNHYESLVLNSYQFNSSFCLCSIRE